MERSVGFAAGAQPSSKQRPATSNAMADDGEKKTVAIRAPANAVPGGKVKIKHAGHEVVVTFPDGVVPGQEIKVQVPKHPAPPAPADPVPTPPRRLAPVAPNDDAPTSGGEVRSEARCRTHV